MSVFVEDSEGNKVLPRPECTYADHSYPAYSKAQMLNAANTVEQLESELTALRSQVAELQQNLQTADEMNAICENRLDELRAKNAELQRQLSDEQEAHAATIQREAKLTMQLDEAAGQVNREEDTHL